ncbi:hypothetical protein CPLU01_07499 [Colletotrichum plurivorum]|uniref:Uncharacterized protein n=1 Tax=Colletotrichum plurivorum TaxID=2175906 RepID=A0A8H6KFN7_9PEZI|nr:hypothetical protein CPLU01_07499 [Colletotrichum plurivorum]
MMLDTHWSAPASSSGSAVVLRSADRQAPGEEGRSAEETKDPTNSKGPVPSVNPEPRRFCAPDDGSASVYRIGCHPLPRASGQAVRAGRRRARDKVAKMPNWLPL